MGSRRSMMTSSEQAQQVRMRVRDFLLFLCASAALLLGGAIFLGDMIPRIVSTQGALTLPIIFGVVLFGSWLLARGSARRRHAEGAMHDLEEAQFELLTSVSDVILTFQVLSRRCATARLKDINRAGSVLLGYEQQDIENLTISDLFAKKSIADLEVYIDAIVRGRQQEPREFVAVTVNGQEISLRVLPRLLPGQAPPLVQFWARDVSDLRRANARMQMAESAFSLQTRILESLESQETLPARLSRSLEILLGTKELDLRGAAAVYRLNESDQSLELIVTKGEVFDAYPPTPTKIKLSDGGLCAEAILADCLEARQHEVDDDKDSPQIPKHGECTVPLMGAGKVKGVLLLHSPPDKNWVHKRREVLEQTGVRLGNALAREEVAEALGSQTEAMESALSNTEQKLIAKSKFQSAVASKIRILAQEISEKIDRVQDGEIVSDHGKPIEAVRHASGSLLKTVNDVLDLSRIETKEFEIDQREFNPRKVIQEAVDTYAWLAEEKGIALKFEIEKEVPSVLIGDPNRLHQVLVNLISNGIKFSDSGQVVVKAENFKLETGAVVLHFLVKDTGLGISDEKQQEIFQVFSSKESVLSKLNLRVGLGLILTSQLVKHMKGRIWIQSTVGKGSNFHFTARFLMSSTQEKRPNAEMHELGSDMPLHTTHNPTAKSLHILVAEGDEENGANLADLLVKRGCRTQCVGTGMEVIEGIAQHDLDLMFVALQLPDVDGLTTIQAIREFEKNSGSHIPIVAMSSQITPGDKERVEAAGADACIITPIRAQEIESLIAMLCRREGNPEADKQTHDQTSQGKDNAMDVSILDKKSALDRLGGDLDLLIELAGMFLDDLPRLIDGLENAIKDGNADAVQRLAHSLKGAVGNFSAHSAFSIAEELETMSREGNLDNAPNTFTNLREEIERLKPALSEL